MLPGIAGLIAVAHGPAPPRPVEILLPARTIELRPSCDDLTVGALWVQIRCLREAGAEERRASGLPYAACDGFTLDGAAVDQGTTMLELTPVARNTVRLEERRIRFVDTAGGHLCIAVRAIFNEVSHQDDVELFAERGDRYSLVSYCTVREQPSWAPNRYVFEQNRVGTPEEFAGRLAKPIAIRLRPR